VSGAYGFRFEGVGDADLVPLPDSAPAVRVTVERGSFGTLREEVSGDRVVYAPTGESGFTVDREPPAIHLKLVNELPDGAIVHPILTVPVAALARWDGALTLHAGAFEASGAGWGVIGERMAGKSTLLGSLAERGCPVVADDLLVVDGDTVRPGPACVDLRPDVAERFAGARVLGEVGGRIRHRLSTRPGSAAPLLAGFLALGWHEDDDVAIEPLPTRELLALLYGHEYIGLLGPADPARILDLLAVPAWRVRRPRRWDATGAVCEALLALAADQAARAASQAA
jgi:hypothetical protein